MIKPIGILGGAFDPIHYGHLRLALDFLQILDLAQVRFIPCKSPVLKEQSLATAGERLSMLELAISSIPQFTLDDRELKRETPSYMIDTLKSLRIEFPQTPLILLLGSDAFLTLEHWKDWRKLLDQAHIVIGLRAGTPFLLNDTLSAFIEKKQIADVEILQNTFCGSVYLQNISQLAISSSEIRSQIACGLNPKFLLPDPVYTFIQQHQLYGYPYEH